MRELTEVTINEIAMINHDKQTPGGAWIIHFFDSKKVAKIYRSDIIKLFTDRMILLTKDNFI
jgi:hypothetical protein